VGSTIYPTIPSLTNVSDVFNVPRNVDVAIAWPALASAFLFHVQAGIAGRASTSAQFVTVTRQSGSLALFTNTIAAQGLVNFGGDLAPFDTLRIVSVNSAMVALTSLAVIAKGRS